MNGTVEELTTLESDAKVTPLLSPVDVLAIKSDFVTDVDPFAKIQ